MLEERRRILKHPKSEETKEKGPVVYWMSRDQRLEDNWALIHAKEIAEEKGLPLVVCFSLVPSFLGATKRQYYFMLKGLKKLRKDMENKGIDFVMMLGDPSVKVPELCEAIEASTIVTDFSPLRIKQGWNKKIMESDYVKNNDVEVIEVDAHNIVPCWEASDKQEFAAYTIRPKITRKLEKFLEEFPSLGKQSPIDEELRRTIKRYDHSDWDEVFSSLKIDMNVEEVDWIKPGEDNAREHLKMFLKDRLDTYDVNRNDPNRKGVSDISPYLHFGQISPQRVALEVKKARKHSPSKDAYLEELIIRRELSDNFCFYNKDYDNPDGFPQWAKFTHEQHKDDKREYTYTLKEFEEAKTHDKYWNAAQMEMVKTGKMHGYMRMYWAKKILEWSRDVKEALKISIYLNDKYELDGRDPNGYVGVMWSIGGVHDRAWPERQIFGKIRYMVDSGLKRKFDAERYASRYLNNQTRLV